VTITTLQPAAISAAPPGAMGRRKIPRGDDADDADRLLSTRQRHRSRDGDRPVPPVCLSSANHPTKSAAHHARGPAPAAFRSRSRSCARGRRPLRESAVARRRFRMAAAAVRRPAGPSAKKPAGRLPWPRDICRRQSRRISQNTSSLGGSEHRPLCGRSPRRTTPPMNCLKGGSRYN